MPLRINSAFGVPRIFAGDPTLASLGAGNLGLGSNSLGAVNPLAFANPLTLGGLVLGNPLGLGLGNLGGTGLNLAGLGLGNLGGAGLGLPMAGLGGLGGAGGLQDLLGLAGQPAVNTGQTHNSGISGSKTFR